MNSLTLLLKSRIKLLFVFYILFFIQCAEKKQNIQIGDYSTINNLAFNNGIYIYPNPLESSDGWGGGNWKWHIIDGFRYRHNSWMGGLAFTGGSDNLIDTCGMRQVSIDFGNVYSFNRIVVSYPHPSQIPNDYVVLYWNHLKSDWDTAALISNVHNKDRLILEYSKINKLYGLTVEDTFNTVTSRKIMFQFNNCNMEHGWISEFEVYYDKPGNRPECLIYK